MMKKVIVEKGRYNRLTVSIVNEGDETGKAVFRIWVTKGRTIEYEEFMEYDLESNSQKHFMTEINTLIQLLNDQYFTSDWDERKEQERKIKQKEYVKTYYKAEKKETQKGYYGYRSWEPEEDRFLKENYKKMKRREIAQALRRSISSINGRITNLGLR